MKIIALLAIMIIANSFAYGQDENPADTLWKKSGNLNINMQQNGFSNWANGGESSVALGSAFNYSLDFEDDDTNWHNSVDMAYGFVNKKEQGLRKNNDLIVITSEFGQKLSPRWKFSASLDIRTQFSDGFEYKIDENTGDEIRTLVSTFLSPGYIQPYVGVRYKKGKSFSVAVSPLAQKITIVTDEGLSATGAYGVDPGKKVRAQFGSNINVHYKKEVFENVTVKSNLLIFGDYQTLNYWDVNYDLFIDFKVNSFLSTNFLLQAIYDHDIKGNSEDESVTGPALQLRNVLNIGFNIKF